MCIYGEYGICSLCPQDECPGMEYQQKKSNAGFSEQNKDYNSVSR